MKASTPLSLIFVCLATLPFSLPASAVLGGDESSVAADVAQMKASISVTHRDLYSVHEMKIYSGTVVREYVSPGGRVFGVAWQGPFIPDLQQLLGTYFQQYSVAAQSGTNRHASRRFVNIQQPGLIVQASGHMRAYSGRAYDPGLLPQGVGVDVVR